MREDRTQYPTSDKSKLPQSSVALRLKALLYLQLVYMLLRVCSFERLSRRSQATQIPNGAIRYSQHEILDAIDSASWRFPWLRTCLVRSLVLSHLLKNAGHPVELKLGVRSVDGTIRAHAWVEDSEGGVFDTSEAETGEYSVLS